MRSIEGDIEEARGNLAQEQETLARLQSEHRMLRLQETQRNAPVDERLRVALRTARAAGDGELARLYEAGLARFEQLSNEIAQARIVGNTQRVADLEQERRALCPPPMIASSSSDPAPRTLSQVGQEISACEARIAALHSEAVRLEGERDNLIRNTGLTAQGESELLAASLAGLYKRVEELEASRAQLDAVSLQIEQTRSQGKALATQQLESRHERLTKDLVSLTALRDEIALVEARLQELTPSPVPVVSAPTQIAPSDALASERTPLLVAEELADAMNRGAMGASRRLRGELILLLERQAQEASGVASSSGSVVATPLQRLQGEVAFLLDASSHAASQEERAPILAEVDEKQRLIRFIIEKGARSSAKQAAALALDEAIKSGVTRTQLLAQILFDNTPN